MEPIVFYDFKPDTEDPNNKIVMMLGSKASL